MPNIKRITVTIALAIACIWSKTCANAADANRKPNIVLILADDKCE